MRKMLTLIIMCFILGAGSGFAATGTPETLATGNFTSQLMAREIRYTYEIFADQPDVLYVSITNAKEVIIGDRIAGGAAIDLRTQHAIVLNRTTPASKNATYSAYALPASAINMLSGMMCKYRGEAPNTWDRAAETELISALFERPDGLVATDADITKHFKAAPDKALEGFTSLIEHIRDSRLQAANISIR